MEPKLLKISWTENMQLIGRTTDAQGRASGRAEFKGKITAQADDASIQCEQRMIIQTTAPVPLERIQVILKGAGSEYLARQPQTKIASIHAVHKVVVIGRMLDPDKKLFRQQQQFNAEALLYDRRSGAYHIIGKGRVWFHENSAGAQLPANDPAAGSSRTDICFSTGLTARVGRQAGTSAVTREVEFTGNVQMRSIGAGDPKTNVRRESRAIDATSVEADKLSFISVTEPPGALHSSPVPAQLKASGHVKIKLGDSITEADAAVLNLRP
jgi:hypothetical protein